MGSKGLSAGGNSISKTLTAWSQLSAGGVGTFWNKYNVLTQLGPVLTHLPRILSIGLWHMLISYEISFLLIYHRYYM